MKNIHANDSEIQKFLFDNRECESQIIKHIYSCEECKKRAKIYKLLSNSLTDQPEPKLEYDLSKLVLDQITLSKEIVSNSNYLRNFIILTTIGLILLAALLFRETLTYLVNDNLLHLNYFIISTVVFISFILGYDIFRSYNNKINMLNL